MFDILLIFTTLFLNKLPMFRICNYLSVKQNTTSLHIPSYIYTVVLTILFICLFHTYDHLGLGAITENLELSVNLRLDKIRKYISYLNSSFDLILVGYGTQFSGPL